MKEFLIIAIIFCLVIALMYIIVLKAKKGNNKTTEEPPYKAKMLLTPHEYNFYRTLKPIADELNLIVMCQVSLSEIIEIPKGTENYIAWFNKIKAKHVDFLLCGSDFSPTLVIELDDSSHDNYKRQKRDDELDMYLDKAEIKNIHFRNWKPQQINDEIKKIIMIDKTEDLC